MREGGKHKAAALPAQNPPHPQSSGHGGNGCFCMVRNTWSSEQTEGRTPKAFPSEQPFAPDGQKVYTLEILNPRNTGYGDNRGLGSCSGNRKIDYLNKTIRPTCPLPLSSENIVSRLLLHLCHHPHFASDWRTQFWGNKLANEK